MIHEEDAFHSSLHPNRDGKLRHHILRERVCEVLLRYAGVLRIVVRPKRLPGGHHRPADPFPALYAVGVEPIRMRPCAVTKY